MHPPADIHRQISCCVHRRVRANCVQQDTAEICRKLYEHGVTRDLETHATGFMLNQTSEKAGVKKHGEKALTVLCKDFL